MNKYIFGVDLGGTTVKMGLFDMNGNVLDKWEIPTVTANKGEQILPDIANSIKAKMAAEEIALDEVAGIGLGAPGPVDADASCGFVRHRSGSGRFCHIRSPYLKITA